MRPRASRPRRLGLLTEVDGEPARSREWRYPYGVGDRIGGDLTVLGHLARGRIGDLYQVWSANGWCALTCKILSPRHRGDRAAVATLRRETRILRRFRHPNLIRGFGGGEHDGLPYLLMEYVAGPSLFELLERRPERRLGLADAIRTAIHIGGGLQHLHRSGYLYLDLKPSNLMLRNRIPVLVDFDTASPLRPGKGHGHHLGTAPYMAPEQVRGEVLTAAADQYALGAVLYEMVTGRWPFEAVFAGDEEREGEERRYPQLGAAPPSSPRRWVPSIPPSLDSLILRTLAAAPGDRFSSLHAFLLALAAELEEPVSLWPHGVEVERRHVPRAQEQVQVRAQVPAANDTGPSDPVGSGS
jgi:serine/threonine protein kinase